MSATINKFIEFLTMQRGVKPSSANAYCAEIRKFQASQKNIVDIKNYSEFSELMITYKKEKNHSDRTTYKIASMFKEFYDFLAMHEIIASPHFLSMGHGFKKGKIPEAESFDRDDPEDKKLIDKILWNPYIEERLRCILFILYSTGIRVSELCALNIEDVDLDRKWVHVRHGKGDKFRYCRFDDDAAMWLSLYIKGLKAMALFDDPKLPLFTTKKGARMKPGSVWKLLNNYANSISIQTKINPHKWRHTFISFVADRKGLHIAAKMAGHDSITSTYKYTHKKPSALSNIYDEITKTA